MKAPFRLSGIGLAIGALSLLACILGQDGGKISSTSISTGNPAGLTFHFEKEAHPIALTGALDIYAAKQIPVPGYRPDPLLRIPLMNTDTARLTASALASIPDTLWPDSSDGKDTLVGFNVILSGDSLGAILGGFAFDKSRGAIIPPVAPDAGGAFHAEVSGLKDYVGQLHLDSSGLSTHRFDFYLFIFGTGYYAKGIGDPARVGDTLDFTIPKIPAGQHDAYLLLLWNPEAVSQSLPDSTPIFRLSSPFRTDSDSLHPGAFLKQVKLPPGYFGP